jgi:Uma2 family endonuclease
MTIRIDDATAYEPDALIYCGQKLPPTAIEVPEPVIVVEVLSPSSRQVDLAIKLAGYFLLRSLAHYLIVDPTRSLILHQSRTSDAILTRVVTEGSIGLHPPGIELVLTDVYAG